VKEEEGRQLYRVRQHSQVPAGKRSECIAASRVRAHAATRALIEGDLGTR